MPADLRRPARRSGFTLLELLVVLLIIGILATVGMLSFGSRALDDRVENEARRLREILRLTQDEALFKGLELGLMAEPSRYEILVLNDEGWAPYAESGPLRARTLPEPLRLDLYVEDRPVPPPDPGQPPMPQVLLLSSGEATAFAADLGAPGIPFHYRVQGDALGRLSLERREAQQ